MIRSRQVAEKNTGPGCSYYLTIFVVLVFYGAGYFVKNDLATKNKPRTVKGRLDAAKNQLRQLPDATIIALYQQGRYKGIIDPPNDRRLIHLASELDRIEVIQEIIRSGEDINQQDAYGNTPLHLAMAGKSDAAVEMLRKSGANFLAVNSNNQSILHFASEHGYYEIAKAAIKAGADVNAMSKGQWAPIHYASSSGHLKIVVLLTENDANISAAMGYGWTAGDMAIDKHKEVANFLHSRNAAFNKGNLTSRTFDLHQGWPFFSLDQISEIPRNNEVFSAMLEDSPEQIANLAAGGSSIDISNKALTPILCLAILHKKFAAAEYLLSHVSNPDAADANGKNALIYAIESGNKALTRLIMQKTTDISHVDLSGNTSLHYAIARCDNDIAAELIDKGANIFAQNNYSRGMIHVATENDNEIMFKSLIANGCDVNQEDIHGDTPLHLAVLQDNIRLVEALLQNGADFAVVNNQQKTPVMLAKSDLVRRTLENRFEIEGQNPAERPVPAEVQILPQPPSPAQVHEKDR